MVMSCSQSMTPILCQVVSYSHLEENDEHGVREISSTTEYVFYDISSCDEGIDQMERVLVE